MNIKDLDAYSRSITDANDRVTALDRVDATARDVDPFSDRIRLEAELGIQSKLDIAKKLGISASSLIHDAANNPAISASQTYSDIMSATSELDLSVASNSIDTYREHVEIGKQEPIDYRSYSPHESNEIMLKKIERNTSETASNSRNSESWIVLSIVLGLAYFAYNAIIL